MDAALEVAVAGQHRGHVRSCASTAVATSSGSGPEFPMHVVHP